MRSEFHSWKELYQRVMPALKVRVMQFRRMGYYDVGVDDIWNYLSESKWKLGHGLMLSDIVDDILHVDYFDIIRFLH